MINIEFKDMIFISSYTENEMAMYFSIDSKLSSTLNNITQIVYTDYTYIYYVQTSIFILSQWKRELYC